MEGVVKMQNYNIKDYSVEFDRTATVDWYEKYEGWGCDCGDCQSFLAWVRRKQLPSAVTELLQIFGALPEKPTYVCELSPTERGHLYQFNYRVVGCMLNVHHPHESIGFDWGSVYCGHEDDPCGALSQTLTLCSLWTYRLLTVRANDENIKLKREDSEGDQ